MSREGNRPRSWANPTLIQEEIDWVQSQREEKADQTDYVRIASLRGPYSDFLPTASHVAFEVHGAVSIVQGAVDPFDARDPWRGVALPKGPTGDRGDVWSNYKGVTAGRATSSFDP